MHEHWYKFRAYNSQPMYGYGTEEEASRYADHLNRNRDINHYAPYRMCEENAATMALRDDGFSLGLALDDIAEYET